MRPLKLRPLFAAGVLVVASLVVSTGAVGAYGAADHPLAQLTVSANCDNRSFPLCAAPPAGVGLGGIWLWIEIDQGGTAEVAGAGCNHLRGVNPIGAGSIHGEAPWFAFHGTPADLVAAFPGTFVVGTDPGGNYYVVPFGFAFPVTTGHYSVRLAPGVQIQSTVAP
jgi:hypothetical protein